MEWTSGIHFEAIYKRVAYLRFIKRSGRRVTGAAGDSSDHPLMKSSMLSGDHHCGISDWCGW